MVRALLLAGVAAAGAACAGGCVADGVGGGGETARVTGTVTYVQRIALPPEAIVQVQLVDASHPDGPAFVLSQQAFAAAGRQVPLPFELAYDPTKVDPGFRYAVEARITVGGLVRWTNARPAPVITGGAPTRDVEVLLTPAR